MQDADKSKKHRSSKGEANTTNVKRRRSDEPRHDAVEGRSSGAGDNGTSAPAISILKNEERAFPRGGGDGLAPLERKQINIQAINDVLFENSQQKKDSKAASDEDSEEEKENPPPKERKRRRVQDRRPAEAGVKVQDRVKIKGLTYKVSNAAAELCLRALK